MSLYDNINAKRKRIAAGSGEKMKSKGDKGAPTDKNFKEQLRQLKNLRKKITKKQRNENLF